MKETKFDFSPPEDKTKTFWKDMFDSENGMGIKIHPSPHYEVPTINQETIKPYFPKEKIESAQKYISNLTSFLNDQIIIEDKFSTLPTEIQNEQREAKKKEFYEKYGELFIENYETKNKLRSIQFTNVSGALQLISLFSNNQDIKQASTLANNKILTLVNGPQQDIYSQDSNVQNQYNQSSIDQKIKTIHNIDNVVLDFLNHLSDPK